MIPQYKVTDSDRQRLIKRLGDEKAISVIVAIEYERLTQQQQAELLDITRMTLYRWRKEPRWNTEYDRLHKKKVRFIQSYFRKRKRSRITVNDILDDKSLLHRMLF